MSAGAGGVGAAAPIAMKEVLSVRIVCIFGGWWLVSLWLDSWWVVCLMGGCFDSALFCSYACVRCVPPPLRERVPWRICGVEWKSFFGGEEVFAIYGGATSCTWCNSFCRRLEANKASFWSRHRRRCMFHQRSRLFLRNQTTKHLLANKTTSTHPSVRRIHACCRPLPLERLTLKNTHHTEQNILTTPKRLPPHTHTHTPKKTNTQTTTTHLSSPTSASSSSSSRSRTSRCSRRSTSAFVRREVPVGTWW